MSLLSNFIGGLWRSLRGRGAPGADEFPVMRQKLLKRAHAGAPTAAHADILFGDLRIGGWPLNDLVARCLAESGAAVPPLKALHRPLASYLLARYYLHALRLPGARAECGVFMGTSALLLCRAARSLDPAHDGSGLHLVDSFQGLSEPGLEDRFTLPAGGGGAERRAMPGGSFAAGQAQVRGALGAFPGVAYHQGWIPAVLRELPEQAWSFVHVDVDLYEPTFGCLAYFYPRLCRGGVIVCDDYGAPAFPGAARAWNRYCGEAGLPFVMLDTGQAVILKD